MANTGATATYRVLRLIEYAGPLEWVNEQIERRGVKGSRTIHRGPGQVQGVIRECVLGEVAALMPEFDLPQQPLYAAGYEGSDGGYGMFDGPVADLVQLLRWSVPDDDKRAHQAVILRLTSTPDNPHEPVEHEVVCRWSVEDSEWKVNTPAEEIEP